MITAVDVRNPGSSLLQLALANTNNGLVVKEIEGLDPVKATIVSSSFASLDGTQYHTSRRGERNIIIRLDLRPEYGSMPVSQLRKQVLYRYFMPKTPVDLTFHQSDGPDVVISGRVEDTPTPLFTKEPAVDISIICFDSDFVDPIAELVLGSTVSNAIETLVTYDGNVETGIVFTLNVNRDLSEFTIYHRPPDGSFRSTDVAGVMMAGDVFKMTTTPGSKSVRLTRGGVDIPFLYSVSPQSNWVELSEGDNYIRVYAEGLPVPFNISYFNRYGGL